MGGLLVQMATHNNDYSWMGWLFGIGLFLLVIFNLSGSSQPPKLTEDAKTDIADQIIGDMQSKYGDLADVGTEMIQGIDNECVWLSDNINESVGEYCGDSTLDNYAYINGASLAPISYNVEDEIEEMIDDIISQGNLSYNELLEKVRESSDAISEECDWLYDNISSGVGDFCNDINSKFESGNFNGDPFSASDYTHLHDESSE